MTRKLTRKEIQGVKDWLQYFRRLPTLAEWEVLLIEEALMRYNRTEAAEEIGITREGLRKKLISLGID